MADDKMLVEFETDHGAVKLSPNIIRRYLVNGQGNVTDEEVVMFINLCRYQQLNPFLKEAYLIKYSNGQPATMVVGKDTFLKRAEKHPQYDGARAGVYVKQNKNFEKRVGTLLLPGEELAGGWAEVFRKDWTHPVEISVSLQEYEGKKKDGTTTRQWTQMPATMIRKVALVQALREAFPDQFQGMFDAAEVGAETPNYQIFDEGQGFASPPQQSNPVEDKPLDKSPEYKKLEAQIMEDLENPLFTGMVELDGKEIDLNYYKTEIPKRLMGRVVSMEKLQHDADVVARMLLAAKDQAEKQDNTDAKLGDEELFNGVIGGENREGNATT